MFKKEITYFVLYFIKGNSNNKFSIYLTSNVQTSDCSSFRKTFQKECLSNHNFNYNDTVDEVIIESIQMISIQLSIFGKRIF